MRSVYELRWHRGIPAFLFMFALGPALAQSPAKPDLDKAPVPAQQPDRKQTRERKVSGGKSSGESQPATSTPAAPGDRQSLRREDESEAEAAILPYINSFFTTTRLGPEDVITVDVFDQPNYSRSNIAIPPSGRINYPVIGQVAVAGRTIEEVEKDITDRLSEYIREPKVTVQLVQVHSMKFMVVGDVVTPGIYEMTRRMTVNEALARAGDVNRFGDTKNISVLRMQPNGQAEPIPVNIHDVRRGKAQDIHLVPGDTIFVPGNKFKTVDKVLSVATLGYWMRVIVR
jgi:polysaccharide export outer membrane protein